MSTSAIDYLVSSVYVCTGEEALRVRNLEVLKSPKERLSDARERPVNIYR